jgi:ribosomal protein S18 acetylase RimI-like enzyme
MNLDIHQTVFTPELRIQILEGLAQHAIESTGINGLCHEPISFEIRDEKQLKACVVAQLFWGQLHIRYVFVEKLFRGQGLAQTLMEKAFAYGKANGCSFAFVETMSFQGPSFYKKVGFQIELVRPGYDKDTSFYYLKRGL